MVGCGSATSNTGAESPCPPGTSRSGSSWATLRQALADLELISRLVPEYDHGLDVHRGPHAAEQAEQWIRDAFPRAGGEVDAEDVITDDAWPALRALLHKINDAGRDPVDLLRQRAAKREFASDPRNPARSATKVLHYRLANDLPYPTDGVGRPDLLPGWVSSPPAPDPDQPDREADPDRLELADWLHARAHRIADRVRDLGEHAAHIPPVGGRSSTTGLDLSRVGS